MNAATKAENKSKSLSLEVKRELYALTHKTIFEGTEFRGLSQECKESLLLKQMTRFMRLTDQAAPTFEVSQLLGLAAEIPPAFQA